MKHGEAASILVGGTAATRVISPRHQSAVDESEARCGAKPACMKPHLKCRQRVAIEAIIINGVKRGDKINLSLKRKSASGIASVLTRG